MEKNLPACPVETTLMLISDRWKVLIIRDLLDGTKRFGEIKKSVGNISQKVLTANLRSMEDSGLLTRKVYPEVPPRVEYTLTETGYSLKPVLDAMVAWGTEYKQKTAETKNPRRMALHCCQTGGLPYRDFQQQHNFPEPNWLQHFRRLSRCFLL